MNELIHKTSETLCEQSKLKRQSNRTLYSNHIFNKQFLNMKKLYILCMLSLLFSSVTYAQVTGIKNVPGDYATLALAIADLNTVGVGAGGATINVVAANPQTAPAGGYVIGGTGSALLTTLSASNPLSFVGNNNTITAFTPQTVGSVSDAIVKIVGADFVQISGFTLQENAGNTVVATAATNTMTEWGIALLYATSTNSPQNITINNNAISLNRTYLNSFGIYANATHTATAPLTSATATTTAGAMSNLVIQSNSISNVNDGIVIVGPTAPADYNNSITIGGASAGLGNSITNYGNTSTLSTFANVSSSVTGILIRNSISVTIQYNTLTIPVGNITGTGSTFGIQMVSSSSASVGTFNDVVSNNTISMSSAGTSATLTGIIVGTNAASPTGTIRMENNTMTDFSYTNGAATGSTTFYSMIAPFLKAYIGNNTANFSSNTMASSGAVTFISHGNTMPANGVDSIFNNTLTGFTKTVGGGLITGFTSSSGSPNSAHTYIVNNTITGISTSNTTAGTTAFTGISNSDGASTSPVKVFKNNNFSNINLGINTGAITGVSVSYLQGAGTSTNTSLQTYSEISGNNFSGYSNAGSITGINLGSSFGSTASGKVDVFNNQVNTYSSTSTTGAITGIVTSNTSLDLNIFSHTLHTFTINSSGAVNGISITGSTRTNVYKNKIYNLTNNNASAVLNGIVSSSGTLSNIYNNIIGDLKTPAINAGNSLAGINISGGTAANVRFNTVRLDGTSTAALFGSSALLVSTTPTVEVRNNILVNATTPVGATGFASAYRRSGTSLTTFAATSNTNEYYAGTPGVNNLIFYDGTNSDQTIAAYKARVAPREANSISENPTFVSTVGSSSTFLHMDTTVPTQIESGAGPIAGITDDFDGDTRSSISPDMGADEFSGVGIDLTAPVITYTTLPFTCDGTVNRTLTATITDASFVPTSGIGLPVLYWKINQGSWNSAQGVPQTQTSFNFSFGMGAVLGDSVSYYIVAQDNAGTPNIGASPSGGAAGFSANPPAASTPPTSPSKYFIKANLTGTYTVGAGGNYTTLTAAVAAYNSSCLTGNVIFSLTDASYTTGETFPIVINSNPYASATTTLTIKPTLANTLISGSSTTSIINLSGTDYVTIDGSIGSTANTVCPPSAASRDLTITNTSTSTASGVVWLSTTAGLKSVTNCTVKNCIISGSGPSQTLTGLGAGGVTVGTGGTSNNDISFINNDVKACAFAIYSAGASAAVKNQNVTINQNIINTASPNNIGQSGIYVAFTNNPIVSGNNIGNIINSASSQDPVGINIGYGAVNGFSSTVIGITDGITNATITNNTIGTIQHSTTYSAIGIALGNTISGTSLIANNMVSGVAGNGTSGDFSSGILIGGGAGNVNLFYNTVSMQGTIPGTTAASQTSACLSIISATPINIKNNIFSNTQLGNAGATLRFAAIALGYSTYTSLISNNNDLYAAGAGPGTYTVGITGTVVAGTNSATLANWQSTTTQDANSKSVLPVFTSSTNLRLDPLNPSNILNFNATGMAVSVTTDIDCGTRDATPDMGADEFFVAVCTGQPNAGVIAPATISKCAGETYTMTATGISTDLGASYQWKVGPVGGPYTNVTGGTGATTNVYTTAALTAGVYEYYLETSCSFSGQMNISNNLTVTVNALPTVAVTPTSGNVCFPGGTAVALSASGADTYTWSPTSGLSASTGASVNALPGGTTTYTVTGTTTANGCTNTASATITVSPGISVSASASPSSICVNGNSQLNANPNTIGNILITEVTVNNIGTGATSPYPSYVTGTDYVEISNISNNPIDVSGYTFADYANNSATASHPFTIPSGTVIPANGVMILNLGTGTDSPANRYFNTGGTSDTWFSTSQVGIVLKNGTQVIDAVGLGGSSTGSYTFASGTGVTAGDWSGFAPNASGFAGVIRTATTDNNTGADWSQANTPSPLQTIGTYNGGYMNTAVITYAWTPSANLNDPTIVNPLATALTSSVTYMVTATRGACSSTSNVAIVVGSSLTSNISGNSTICNGASSTLTANPVGGGEPYTYLWDNPSSSTTQAITVTPMSSTTYNVTITDACMQTSVSAVSVTVNPLPTATTTPSGTLSICAPSSQTITATTNASSPSYIWKNGINPIGGATLSAYTANASGNYRVIITDGITGCKDSSAVVSVTVNPQPSTITISPNMASICAGSTQALSFTGGLINTSAQVGTGLTTNSTSSYPAPLSNYYGGTKHQMLIRASELTALGLIPNASINSIEFDVSAVGSAFTGTLNNFQVDMANTTNTVLSSTSFVGSLTNVRAAANLVVPTTGLPQTLNIPITPFVWNGTDNLLIQTSYSNVNSGTVNTAVQMRNSDPGFVSSNWYRADGVSAASILAASTPTSSGNARPNMKLYYSVGTTTAWSPTTELYTDAAATIAYTGGTETTVYAKPTSNITYQVTATSAAGCTNTASVAVTVSPLSVGGTVSSDQTICSGTSPMDLNLSGQTGSVVKWQKSADAAFTSPVDIVSTSTTLTGAVIGALTSDTYFRAVVQSGTCSSANSASVLITIGAPPAAPTGAATQSFCSSASPTVANLLATGTSIKWYDMATGGMELAPTTPLVNGNHYYASQTISGCESTARLDVTASIEGTVVTTSANTGAGSLRSVVACASEGTTITIDAGVTSITMTEALNLDKNLMIMDMAGAPVMITFDFTTITTYGINIIAGKTVTLENLGVTAINNPSNLPLIQVDGILNAKNVTTNQ